VTKLIDKNKTKKENAFLTFYYRKLIKKQAAIIKDEW